MASILNLGGRWRALIRLKGFKPRCRTFDSEASAREWATREERAMKGERADAATRRLPCGDARPYRVSGVYMLIKGGEVQYVGRSVHVYRRLNDHDRGKSKRDWDFYSVIEVSDAQEMAAIEHRLIKELNPPWNRQMRA